MLDLPLVYERTHPGQARYHLARINQLLEMLEFFCGNEKALVHLKDFEYGRKRYLDREILSHYWTGIKTCLQGEGLTYIGQVHQLQKQFGYRGFPWLLALRKISSRFFNVLSLP